MRHTWSGPTCVRWSIVRSGDVPSGLFTRSNHPGQLGQRVDARLYKREAERTWIPFFVWKWPTRRLPIKRILIGGPQHIIRSCRCERSIGQLVVVFLGAALFVPATHVFERHDLQRRSRLWVLLSQRVDDLAQRILHTLRRITACIMMLVCRSCQKINRRSLFAGAC